MELDRRTFLILPAAAALTGGAPVPTAAESGALAPQIAAGALVGARRLGIHRIGQLNMTEHDPVALDVEAWADYWASLEVDVVLVSVTGILAFYQTKVPFHRKGKYLGTRDFFGDCFAAAKKRGLKVIARMSPDLNWEDATRAHPEWFQRDAQDRIVVHTEDARLFRTCMFSTYMTDYVPAVMKEVLGQYDVDGVYTNAWPPLGSIPRCACGVCRTLPPHGTLEHWEAFNRRTIELWRLYDGLAKAKKPSLFYFGNLGGGVRSTADLVSLGELADWFQCDNQGRGGDDTPIWGCAMQGRVCHAVQPDKMATNVTGAWSTGAPRWRNVHKAIPEARMWMNETVASGMVPYHHIIGGETGLGEDRRALEPARQFFDWHAQHQRHFTNRRSIASIGVVMGQRGQLFHTPPAGSTMPQYLNGLYLALLEGRFLFDFLHELQLTPQALARYAAVLLPNVAWLSDAQCDALRTYVAAGGSLLGTFQTSLFDDRGKARADFALADVFGIRKAGEIVGTTGNAYMGRIEGRHPILDGFGQTPLIPGAEYRVPLAPVDGSALTVVPGYVAYPPELSYPEPA
ncbi:MAG: alpha-amylase family protein, partial [Vicinamibacteria bacterium]